MSFMACTLLFVAIGNVANMRTILPTLPFIAHKLLATADAGVLHLGVAFEQVAMGIPPSYSALVRAEAALPMTRAEHETHTALVADATFNWDSFYFKRFWMQIAQAKGFHCIT